MITIYLDSCCLNRSFDDQTQDRIHLETEAIILILNHLYLGEFKWLGSEILDLEVKQVPNQERRYGLEYLLSYIDYHVKIKKTEIDRAKQLEELGFDPPDALHIACAESGKADIFLTTDDRLLKKARRFSKQIHLHVKNPIIWLKEVYK
jgi:predicted nucleic acid-binding protein